MSADTTAAAYNNLVKFAQQLRGIMAFTDELKDYASFKQSREDEEKAVAAARGTLASLNDESVSKMQAIATLAAQVAAGEHELELDKAHAEQVRKDARIDAERIASDAAMHAALMKRDADKYIDGRKTARDSLAAEIESLQTQLEDRQTALANVTLKVQAMQERHEKMVAALDAAKEM